MKQGKGTLILNDHRLFSCKWILNCPLLLLLLGFIIVILLIILLIFGIVALIHTGQCLGYFSNKSLIIESNHCIEFYISSFIPKSSLEYIDIGDDCFENVKNFVINGLNKLKSLKIGRNSFYSSSFEIKGIIDMILILNRSSTFEFYYIRL